MTETDQAPDVIGTSKCNGTNCGKTDDHPKVHVLGNWVQNPDADEVVVIRNPSFHYDCLPQKWVDGYQGDPTHARMLETRRAAVEDGLRGQKLREYHHTLPDDNDPAIAEAYAASLQEG